MKLTRRHLGQAVLTILLVLGVVLSLLFFIRDNARRIALQNEEYINELTVQRAISIDNLIEENLSFIRATAYLYGESISSPEADVDIIREYEENTVFDMLRFVDTKGDNYTSAGLQANLADRDYIQAGLRGEAGVTYVLQSRVTGERQIGFYAPVTYQGKIIGVMVGFFGEEYITRLLEYELFGYEGNGLLCTLEGVVLGETSARAQGNYLDYLAENQLLDGETLSALSAALREGRGMGYDYELNGDPVTVYAVPLNNAPWALFRSFPPEASQSILRNANREGFELIFVLILLFALYGLSLGVGVIMEQRRTRAANRDANDVSTGVSRLFEKFVILDLRAEEYHYASGDPDPGLAARGPYEALVRTLLDAITDPEQRALTEARLSPAQLRETLGNQESISFRVHAPALGAEWFTLNLIVLERSGSTPTRLLILRQDVTELRQKEEQEQRALQEALNAAESASRAKTEFLFNMSHDLRTPMNAIIGYTELAEREEAEPAQTREYIRKIGQSGKHLLSLINDILEMSRIESGKITLQPEPVSLKQIVSEAQELFSSQMAEKKIDFQVSCGEVREEWVLGDVNKLNRVLLNLISNAYKFTEKGGKITVTLREQPAESPAQRSYELKVADNGIGMSEEFQQRLFHPFERERSSTVSKTQGTGLGLSITRNFVDMMGGTIAVQSRQGEGTEFTVRLSLPLAEDQPEAQEAAPEQRPAADFSGVRLLLVEDNEINREIASMILSSAGFQLDTAENGQQAVEKVTAAPAGTWRVILMDIQMPVMDGYTATRAIRALPEPEKANLPIIAMTANAFQEDVQAALDAGMNGHIAKPLDVQRMMETLSQILQNA